MCVLSADHAPGTVGGVYVHFKIFLCHCEGGKKDVFFRRGKWEPEKLSDLLRITQQTQVWWTPLPTTLLEHAYKRL